MASISLIKDIYDNHTSYIFHQNFTVPDEYTDCVLTFGNLTHQQNLIWIPAYQLLKVRPPHNAGGAGGVVALLILSNLRMCPILSSHK